MRSDIWALGVSLVELAVRYPYPDDLDPYSLITMVREEPSPSLPAEVYSQEFCHFVACCVQKDPLDRPFYYDPPQSSPGIPALTEHPFVAEPQLAPAQVLEWFDEIRQLNMQLQQLQQLEQQEQQEQHHPVAVSDMDLDLEQQILREQQRQQQLR